MTRTRPTLRLLHASDCHLGSQEVMTAKERAFEDLIDLAGSQDVDALLVCGDLFDTPRAKGDILEWTAAQFDRLPCPAVVLPGNHDWFEDQSPFLRIDFGQRCRDVHVLDGEVIVLPELDAAFFGRPVREHTPSFRPIADLPDRPDVGWAVVMGHGLVLESDDPVRRGSPIYSQDVAAVDWDYVALGHWSRHWHVQTDPVPVVYSGDTVCSYDGRPGAVLVELSPTDGVTPTWTPL